MASREPGRGLGAALQPTSRQARVLTDAHNAGSCARSKSWAALVSRRRRPAVSDESTLIRPEPYERFSSAHLAAAAYLARYSGRTRHAYAADLRGYLGWCATRQLD